MTIPKTWYWLDEKHHLVAINDDGGKSIVTSKVWSRGKQSWQYHAQEQWLIERQIRDWPQTPSENNR